MTSQKQLIMRLTISISTRYSDFMMSDEFFTKHFLLCIRNS